MIKNQIISNIFNILPLYTTVTSISCFFPLTSQQYCNTKVYFNKNHFIRNPKYCCPSAQISNVLFNINNKFQLFGKYSGNIP